MRIVLILVVGIVLSSCGSKEVQTRTPEEIQDDLRKAELHSPSMYLQVEGTLNESQVVCTVSSTAKVAEYTQVQVAVNYFSDARSLMRTDLVPAEQAIKPGASVQIQHQVTPPEGYATVSFAVRSPSQY